MSESELKELFLEHSDSDSNTWEISWKDADKFQKFTFKRKRLWRLVKHYPMLYWASCLFIVSVLFISIFLLISITYGSSLIFPSHRRLTSIMKSLSLSKSRNTITKVDIKDRLLIDTAVCRLKEHPLWSEDVLKEFVSRFNEEYNCDDVKEEDKVHARRINYNQVIANELDSESGKSVVWDCIASEVYNDDDSYEIDVENSIKMKYITVFYNSTLERQWDSVQIYCENKLTNVTYKEVIPLVQDHINRNDKNVPKNKTKYNVIMLGLDSISRENAQRHLRLLNSFYSENGFVEMLGYHKVGENTFPNVVPLLTGHFYTQFYNFSMLKNFTWDNVPFLWREFQAHNYTTAFFEDMPPYAIFGPRGGFDDQPTDYYTRPTQKLFWKELTNHYSCYSGRVENDIHWHYLSDLLDFYGKNDNTDYPHFTFMHLSTLTHDYFNHAGYADVPYTRFFKRLFTSGHNKNTVIMSFADHSLRFGGIVDTDANIYESMLPYFHIYIPDSLVLEGKNANELRAILRQNQKKLTSHFDAHATARHILYGHQLEDEKYGRSLLSPIPDTRTCEDAGILPEYCMCNNYEKITPSTNVTRKAAQFAVDHVNLNILRGFKSLCAELALIETHRVFETIDRETNKHRWMIVFKTAPNNGLYSALIDLRNKSHTNNQDGNGEMMTNIEFESVLSITRLSRYSSQSDCIDNRHDKEPYCYCKDLL